MLEPTNLSGHVEETNFDATLLKRRDVIVEYVKEVEILGRLSTRCSPVFALEDE